MFLAQTTTETTGFNFQGFDIFMIAFTILIAWGVIRLAKQKEKNKLALGFSTVALIVFLFTDVLMVMNWFNMLGS